MLHLHILHFHLSLKRLYLVHDYSHIMGLVNVFDNFLLINEAPIDRFLLNILLHYILTLIITMYEYNYKIEYFF